jgi:hypothetical protein
MLNTALHGFVNGLAFAAAMVAAGLVIAHPPLGIVLAITAVYYWRYRQRRQTHQASRSLSTKT